jgi:carbamoyltransferase
MFKATSCFWRRQYFAYHPVIGWWHIPNVRARIPLGDTFHLIRTNASGLRSNRNYPLKTPTGQKRIVLLGDSYSAGDGVNNEERYSDLLEQRYHPYLDVMNFGLNGSGTDQQLLIYENIAKNYEADAYIFAILAENIVRNIYTCFPTLSNWEQTTYYRPKPYFTLENGNLSLHNQPVPLEKRRNDQLGDWKCSFPYLPEYPEDAYAVYRFKDGEHWQLLKKIIERFLEQVEGKPVFIMPLPMDDHYLEKAPAIYLERFKELDDPSRMRYLVNVLPDFLSYPKKEREQFRFPNDPHYTAFAHEVVADSIEAHIKTVSPDFLSQTETV